MSENYIGKQLRIYREAAGYSVEKLSYFLNENINNIRCWETGEKEPDITQWLILSELYGVSVKHMLSGISARKFVDDDKLEEYNHEVWLNHLVRRSQSA